MDIKFFLFAVLNGIMHSECVIGEETRVTVKEGDNAILNCTLKTDFKRVMWRRSDSVMPLTVGETVFPGDYRLSIDKEGTSWSLKINNVVMSDGGKYECRVSDDGIFIMKSFFLNVQALPANKVTKQPDNTPSITNITLSEGETALFPCSVEDHSLSHIIWKKESTDTVISVDHHVFIRDDRIRLEVDIPNWDLIITDLKASDSGKYVCLATDYKRVVSKAFNFKVLAVSEHPTTPIITITTAKRTDDSNNVSEIEEASINEVTDKLLKATQLQFYKEEILTDQKKRQLIEIEKNFFKVAMKYFETRGEKDSTQ